MKQETVSIKKRNAVGLIRTNVYPANSAVVKRYERRGRVVWSGGTKVGKFSEK